MHRKIKTNHFNGTEIYEFVEYNIDIAPVGLRLKIERGIFLSEQRQSTSNFRLSLPAYLI